MNKTMQQELTDNHFVDANKTINGESAEYDSWNELKKYVQQNTTVPAYFPQEGDVWVSSLGKNIGYEQNGMGVSFVRPILIIKRFNNHMFWCVPLSTTQKQLDFYYNFVDPGNQNVSAILAQLKLISIKRLSRKLYEIQPEIFHAIKENLRDFLA